MNLFSMFLRATVGPARRQSQRSRVNLPRLVSKIVELERRELLAADIANDVAEVASQQSATLVDARETSSSREVVIIDAAVENPEMLLEGISPEADVVFLQSNRNGLEQITEALSMRGSVRAVHIFAHGTSGAIQLAGESIDQAALERHSALLKSWRSLLTNDADILVYGCNTGSGIQGERWMRSLASITEADIAASDDLTGSAVEKADWTLEKEIGAIEQSCVIMTSSLDRYGHTLTITIRAAGATGTESMALLIDGVTVANFSNVGGNFSQRQFQTFTYNNPQPVTANRIQIAFTNDLFSGTVDRNLRVDSITIDGRTFETEGANVYSTGTWQAGVGVTPGYKQSEILNVNGRFYFAEDVVPGKTNVTIWAAGETNQESMRLLVDGKVVQSWNNIGGNATARQFVPYSFQIDDVVTANRVQVEYTNDAIVNGVDRNLRIDRIQLNNAQFETESNEVFSTGTYQSADGIVPGYRNSEYLHANGYFQYDAKNPPRYGIIGWESNSLNIAEGSANVELKLTRNGGSDGIVTVNYRTVPNSASTNDFASQSGTVTFKTGETNKSIFLNVSEDSSAEPNESFSLLLENPTGGAILSANSNATITIPANDYGLPNFPDFTSVNSIQFNGSATRVGRSLQLTPPEGGLASVYYNTPIPVNSTTSFQTQFQFRIRGGQGTDGADGLVFVMQNSSAGRNALSVTEGKGLGYWQIPRSLGIEFDTFKNDWDIDGNHISIFANGDMARPLATQSVAFDLNSGDVVNAWVDYNAETEDLSVFVSQSNSKPLLPLLTTRVKLSDLVGNQAFVGFSAATGGLVNAHEILGWNFTTNPPSSINPNGVIGIDNSAIQVNENSGTAIVTINRGQGTQGTVTVDYRTIASSAVVGADFNSVSGTVTFAPGETRKQVPIPLINDQVREAVESLAFTIDNVTGGATLLAPRTATITITDDDVRLPNFVDFSNATNLDLNGSATLQGTRLQLTPSEGGYASAFFTEPLIVTNETSFKTAFQFRIRDGQGSNGADGLTFVIQNSPARTDAIFTGAGEGLGYQGITNSVAVEFDTFKNDFDINNNHVSVLTNGNIKLPLAVRSAPIDLNSGNTVFVWIDYNGSGNQLSIYLSNNNEKPDQAWLTANVDLAALVGSQAYLGFTAATGGLTNRHEILSWQFNTETPPLTLPDPSPEAIGQVVASGFFLPTSVAWAPDGSNMYVAEKSGMVKVVRNGQVQATPFIDITGQTNSAGDRGLLAIAVHPDFANNHYVYLLNTYDPPETQAHLNDPNAKPDGVGNRAGRLIRVTADPATNYTTAIAGSEVILLGKNSTWNNFNGFVDSTFDFNERPGGLNPDGTYVQDFVPTDSETHSIADLKFGPDGSLYVSIGDGVSYNQVDPRGARVLDVNSLSGKVLRINPITGDGYADNPYYNSDPQSNRSKVYYLGLRNPFRISVHPTTGQVFVGDVGWGVWEEINTGAPGANFGWPYFEGGNGNNLQTALYRDLPAAKAYYASNPNVTPAILALNHGADGINAIIVGDVYLGTAYGSNVQGNIFFNDLGQGIVRRASLDAQGNVSSVEVFALNANYVVSIVNGPDGHLYYVDLDDGTIGRWVLI